MLNGELPAVEGSQMKPGWINPEAIEYNNDRTIRRWLIFSVTVFDYNMPGMPLTFIREDGKYIRILDTHGTTDFASTPPLMWSLPGFAPQRFPKPATFHDDIYRRHAVLISSDGQQYRRHFVSRSWADDLLQEMIAHDTTPGNWLEAHAYHDGVRLGGWAAWQKKSPQITPGA